MSTWALLRPCGVVLLGPTPAGRWARPWGVSSWGGSRLVDRALERVSSAPSPARRIPNPVHGGERAATKEQSSEVGAPGHRRQLCTLARRRHGSRGASTLPPVVSTACRICAVLTRTRAFLRAFRREA